MYLYMLAVVKFCYIYMIQMFLFVWFFNDFFGVVLCMS